MSVTLAYGPPFVCVVWALLIVAFGRSDPLTVVGLLALAAAMVFCIVELRRRYHR